MQATVYCKRIVFIYFIFCVLCGLFGCEGKTRDQLYAEGLEQVEKGNPGGAVVFLKNALEKDPNFFDARYQLASAYTSMGKYEQAEKEFLKLARQNPSHGGIKLGLAKIYVFTNKPDLAIEKTEEYLRGNPADYAAFELLGTSYAGKGKIPEAEEYLRKAVQFDSGKTSAKLELARVYASTGKTGEARSLLDEVIRMEPKNSRTYYMLASLETSLGKKDKALQVYGKILEINPNDAQALFRSGLLHLETGGLNKAEQAADALVKRFAKRSEGYRLKGIIHYRKKNYPAAMAELLNSIRIQPTLEAYYFLGLSHYNRGELENALSQFRKILDHNPDFTRARILTGMILLQQKRIDDSITEINKVIQADKNNALAHNLLGSAYMAKGLYDEGLRELNRATEIDPRIVDAHLKKGLFHLSKGKRDEAETDFKTAVKVAPEVLNTRLILSSYYMRQGNSAKALSTLRDGLSGKKGDAILYNNMAGIMFAGKKTADGMAYLQKAKAVDPDFLASFFNLAAYYITAGDKEKALNEYRAALQKDPVNVKAILNMASLLDLMGRDREAREWYGKAVKTGNSAAFLALSGYHMKKKEPGKAISVLDDAIKAVPGNPAVLELKGRILLGEKKYTDAVKTFDDLESVSPGRGLPLKVNTYVLMKDYSRAIEHARRIITLKPDSVFGYLVLASVYQSRNDLTQAIVEVNNGIRVDRDSVEGYMMLGSIYEKRNDFDAAMNTFENALKKNRNYAPALFAQGALLEKMAKKKEAVGKYRDALAKSDHYVPALNNLAYLCADGYGSAQDAVRLAVTAYQLEPGNPGVMDTLGYALMKNGRYDDARKVLEKAAGLLPDNPVVLYHLALTCKAMGDRTQAAANLRKALQLGTFPEAGKAKILLAELNGTNRSGRPR